MELPRIRFLMKRETHQKELLFATSFSWWSRDSEAKPAQQTKFSTIRPPTEVGGKQRTCGKIAMPS